MIFIVKNNDPENAKNKFIPENADHSKLTDNFSICMQNRVYEKKMLYINFVRLKIVIVLS